MSRCFPYPPPRYLRQGFVESIKLEREKVLSKTEQKIHKKREKKEKEKKGRKGKETDAIIKKLDDGLAGMKDEQLEKSDLTEEHDLPVCYLSDGTRDSKKRKRETLSPAECRVNGNPIKIRFTFQKPRETDACPSEQPVCPPSGRVDSSSHPKSEDQCYPLNAEVNTNSPVPEQQLRHDTERRKQIPSSSGTSMHDDELQKAALQYKALIEDWVPLPLQLQNADDNGDDWLFNNKQQGQVAAKRSSQVDTGVTCLASVTSWPRAHLLPEAEIYALPYAVPF